MVAILIFILLLFSTTTMSLVQNSTMAQERSQNSNMRELLESLSARVEAQPGFEVSIKFAQPLMDNDEILWSIPYSPQDQDLYRTFGEIGNDFICFDERAGSANVTRCTPFSNIISLGYLDNF